MLEWANVANNVGADRLPSKIFNKDLLQIVVWRPCVTSSINDSLGQIVFFHVDDFVRAVIGGAQTLLKILQ